MDELKIDHSVSARSVRKWKKDVKARYFTFPLDKEKLARFLSKRQEEIDEDMEKKPKQEQREGEHCSCLRQEKHERSMWQEKIDAELQATHKRLNWRKTAVQL